MENNEIMEVSSSNEISVAFLFTVLKKCWIFVIIGAIVLGALGGLYSVLTSKTEYVGTISFYTNNVPANQGYVSQAQTTAAAALANSCVEIVNQSVVIGEVVKVSNLIEILGLQDSENPEVECVSEVSKMISAKKQDSSAVIFYVTVKSDNLDKTFAVVEEMQNYFPDALRSVLGFNSQRETPKFQITNKIESKQDIKVQKNSPEKAIFLGAVLGAVATYGVFFCIQLSKEKKKSSN